MEENGSLENRVAALKVQVSGLETSLSERRDERDAAQQAHSTLVDTLNQENRRC